MTEANSPIDGVKLHVHPEIDAAHTQALSGQRHLIWQSVVALKLSACGVWRREFELFGRFGPLNAKPASQRAINNYLASARGVTQFDDLIVHERTRRVEDAVSEWYKASRRVNELAIRTRPLSATWRNPAWCVCVWARTTAAVCMPLFLLSALTSKIFKLQRRRRRRPTTQQQTLSLFVCLLFQIESLIIVSDTWRHYATCYQQRSWDMNPKTRKNI